MRNWITREVTVLHEVGLHARPSVKLTKVAKAFNDPVEIANAPNGPWVDAKSIVKVMALKVPQNSVLYMRASGEKAEAALQAICDLVDGDFQDTPENATGG